MEELAYHMISVATPVEINTLAQVSKSMHELINSDTYKRLYARLTHCDCVIPITLRVRLHGRFACDQVEVAIQSGNTELLDSIVRKTGIAVDRSQGVTRLTMDPKMVRHLLHTYKVTPLSSDADRAVRDRNLEVMSMLVDAGVGFSQRSLHMIRCNPHLRQIMSRARYASDIMGS